MPSPSIFRHSSRMLLVTCHTSQLPLTRHSWHCPDHHPHHTSCMSKHPSYTSHKPRSSLQSVPTPYTGSCITAAAACTDANRPPLFADALLRCATAHHIPLPLHRQPVQSCCAVPHPRPKAPSPCAPCVQGLGLLAALLSSEQVCLLSSKVASRTVPTPGAPAALPASSTSCLAERARLV
jgi:hypothetical protein